MGPNCGPSAEDPIPEDGPLQSAEEGAGATLNGAVRSEAVQSQAAEDAVEFLDSLSCTLDGGFGLTRDGVLKRLSTCTTVAECRIWLAWGFKNQLLSVTTKAAGPSQAAGRSRSGGLFPLPVMYPEFLPSGPPSLAATEDRAGYGVLASSGVPGYKCLLWRPQRWHTEETRKCTKRRWQV